MKWKTISLRLAISSLLIHLLFIRCNFMFAYFHLSTIRYSKRKTKIANVLERCTEYHYSQATNSAYIENVERSESWDQTNYRCRSVHEQQAHNRWDRKASEKQKQKSTYFDAQRWTSSATVMYACCLFFSTANRFYLCIQTCRIIFPMFLCFGTNKIFNLSK